MSAITTPAVIPVSTAYPYEGQLISTPENREYLSSELSLRRACDCGVILEAPALLCDSNLSLTVDLGCMRGVIPREEAVYCPDGSEIKDIAVITRVGRPVCFKVTGFTERGGERIALLSRRSAQRECLASLLRLTPGDIIDARVTHLEQFGAFCDIGCGIVSLLPVDCISVSRISHPRDRFYSGMRLRVIIRSIDVGTGRICLSHKELLGTWQENADCFTAGQTVAGVVRGVEEYGVFVELTPNLAGLAEYRDDVAPGQTAAVYIKSVMPERMKIKLVIIDSYRGGLIPQRMRYFLGEGENHIDYWKYSPRGCPKIIESNFMDSYTER